MNLLLIDWIKKCRTCKIIPFFCVFPCFLCGNKCYNHKELLSLSPSSLKSYQITKNLKKLERSTLSFQQTLILIRDLHYFCLGQINGNKRTMCSNKAMKDTWIHTDFTWVDGMRLWQVLSHGYAQSICLETLLLKYQSPTASAMVWQG